MKIARKSSTKKIKIGGKNFAMEYPAMSKQIHGSVIKIEKRYPGSGYSINEVCTELVYVLEGSGKLVGQGQFLKFGAGDQLVIEPGEKYYWEGRFKIFVPCAPAWYLEQHKFLK